MDNPQPTDIAWLAGIIDGEGSVMMVVYKTRNGVHYNPAVTIGNTDAAMVIKIVEVLDGLECTSHIRSAWRPKSTKEFWEVHVVAQPMILKLLEAVIPYLVTVKRAKAELLLRYLRSRASRGKLSRISESELDIVDRIRRLNDSTQDAEQAKIESELRGNLVERSKWKTTGTPPSEITRS